MTETSGHTLSTLKELMEAKEAALFHILAEKDRALEINRLNFEKRMDSTNEWRGALDDLTKTMASQEYVKTLEARLEKSEQAQTAGNSKIAAFIQIGALLMGSVGFAVGLITIIGK